MVDFVLTLRMGMVDLVLTVCEKGYTVDLLFTVYEKQNV